MRIENIESEEIKKDGLWWGVLKCLHKTLSQVGFGIAISMNIKLEPVKSIISR